MACQVCCPGIVCICTFNIIKDGFKVLRGFYLTFITNKRCQTIFYNTWLLCWHCCFLYNQFHNLLQTTDLFSKWRIHGRRSFMPSMTSTCNNSSLHSSKIINKNRSWFVQRNIWCFEMQMVAIGNIAMDTAEKPFEGGLLLFQKLFRIILCIIVSKSWERMVFALNIFFYFILKCLDKMCTKRYSIHIPLNHSCVYQFNTWWNTANI